MLLGEEIDANAETFQRQAFKVLDPERTEVRRNGEWLDMPMEELFALARTSTVAQLLERDDFARAGRSRRARAAAPPSRSAPGEQLLHLHVEPLAVTGISVRSGSSTVEAWRRKVSALASISSPESMGLAEERPLGSPTRAV